MAYADADIERGLTALAVLGDSEQASEHTGIPSSTIRSWTKNQPERYEHILNNRARLIDQACIDEFRNLAQTAVRVSLIAVKQEEKNLLAGRTREPGQSGLNLIKTAALAIDKIALMEGRPTSITEHRTADDILRGLEKQGYLIDSTAEELSAEEAQAA
jgi:ATP-dependent exoDNAse (exonuclease V) alpha subunit